MVTLHPQSKLTSKVSFKTTKAKIPFTKTIRQDVQLKYTPHQNLVAEVDQRHERSFFATWNEESNFSESKSIDDLPIDEEFGAIIRIMVKQLGSSTSDKEVYTTVDCEQEKMNTSLWFCKNKQQIYGSKICDGEKDCVDDSDESSEMCFGTNMKLLVIVKSVNITILIFGYLVFSVLLVGSNKFLRRETSNDHSFNAEDIECCKLVFRVCKKNAAISGRRMEDATDANDFTPIVEEYKILHAAGKTDQIRFLYCCIRNLALNESLNSTCMALSSVLISLEHKDLHNDSNQANKSLKDTLSLNWPLSNFVIESEERNGIISRTIVFCKGLLPAIVSNNVGFFVTIMVIFFRLLVTPILPYYDFYADLSLTTTMHHIQENFITSESKARAVSYINLDSNGYYFFVLNILSMGLIARYCWIKFAIMAGCKGSILSSVLKLTSNKRSRILLLIYSFFPYHTMAFELTNIQYCRLKKQQEIRSFLDSMIKKERDHNVDEDIRKLLVLQHELESTFTNGSKVKKIFVGVGIIVLLFESIPQIIVLLSLLHSELTNGFGRLGMLMENVMHTYLRSFGVPKSSSFIVIMAVNVAQICISLIAVVSSTKYGLDLGIIGGAIKIFSILIMLSAKLVLLTLQLYQTPYFYVFVGVAELTISYIFCKITQEKVVLMEDVFPISVTPALYVTSYRKIRNKDNPLSKFQFILKWNGALSIAILHFANLVLIYVPMFYGLPAFQTMIGQHIEDNHKERMYGLVVYSCAIFPFLALMLAYNKFGRRWAKLEA